MLDLVIGFTPCGVEGSLGSSLGGTPGVSALCSFRSTAMSSLSRIQHRHQNDHESEAHDDDPHPTSSGHHEFDETDGELADPVPNPR